MKDQLDRLEEKLDKMIEKTASIDVTLAKQSVILDEHVKRSNLLEAKLAPVERHVAVVHGILKLIGVLTALVGAIKGFLTLKGS